MRLLRATLIFLVTLLVAALLAAWLVPPQLDWARYRTTIAQIAGTRLGLPVTIEGPVTLRLLPEPVLTAGKVSVGNIAEDGMVVRVQALRLRLALWPLLAGRIDARELVLHRPDLHIPWPARPDVLQTGPPLWLAAFAAQVEDGQLSVGQFAVTGINGTLSSLRTGGLRAAVGADIAGQRWRVHASLTNASPAGSADLDVRMQGEGKAAGTSARFTGAFTPAGPLAGKVTASGPNLSLLLPTPPLRFQAQGRLTIAEGLAEADELTVMLDGAPATGAVALRVLPHPRLDIALSATRLALDPWVPLLLTQPAERRSFPIGLDFSVHAATLAGATLRHLRATFELVPGAVLVQDAGADLPGNASVQVAGSIDRGPGADPEFLGTGRLHAPVLRTTLHWLLPHAAADIAALPADVALRADLSGRLVLQPGRIALSGLHGRLDDDTLSGSVSWKAGKPPAVAADIHLDRMRLGPWLTRGVGTVGLRQIVLHQLDTDLRLNVHQASLGGTAIDSLKLDVATLGGGVHLRRLQGTVLGARFAASGTVGPHGTVSDGSLTLTTDDALQLAYLLPVAWRARPALWYGPTQLAITAAGPRKAVAGKVSLDLGHLHVRMQPTVNLDAGTAVGSLTIQDPNAQRLIFELGLPARLGLDGVPTWLGEGSASLVARLGVGPGWRVSLDHALLVAGHLWTRLDLALDARGSEPKVTGTLDAEALPLPLPVRGLLPVGLLHGWQATVQVKAGRVLDWNDATLLRDATATVQVRHDTLLLEHLGGRLSGGTLSANASLDAAQKPPALAVQATLNGAAIDGPVLGLPIDLSAGTADLTLSLRAAGYGTDALVASLTGTAQAMVRDGALSGFDLGSLHDLLKQAGGEPAEPELRKTLDGGTTAFQRLSLKATLARGILSLDQAALTATAGTAEATGSMALTDGTADLRVVLHPALPDRPSVAVLVNGPLTALQRTPELAGLAGWGSKPAR